LIGFKQGLQFLKFSTAISAYMAKAVTIETTTPDLMKRRKRLSRLVSFYSKIGLRILNIDLKVNGKLPDGNFLIVCNHMGYLDVICLATVLRSNFVTSVEIRETPFLGYLTQLGGCLYVERRNKSNLINEIKDVVDALKCGINVCIFPEATSTDGSEVIRFRRPLFRAAQEAKVPVLPVTINYNRIDGEIVDVKTRDLLCWYGEMSFLPHLLKMMTLKKIEISLDIHEPVTIHTEEEVPTTADATHDLVASRFRPLGAIVPPPHLTVQ
jgi:lyso-ornithine lipid O-acyltransferase